MSDLFFIKYYDLKEDKIFKLPLEEMVEILLPNYMDISFHIDALKAQAIVIRTNLVRRSLKLKGEGCKNHEGVDFCKSSHCYNFKNIEEYLSIWGDNFNKNRKKIKEAVEDTKGIILTINGKPIQAKFHHACGGSTENAENVLKHPVIYLRKVLCNYCVDSPKWENEKDFSVSDIEEKLNIKFPINKEKIEIKEFIEDVERDEEGRVKYAYIGGKKFEGKELMDLLNLSSTRFSFFPTNIRFVSQGDGHGLGLCQEGSRIMAEKGYSFEDILKYYYTGIEIVKYSFPSIKQPLFGKTIVIDPGHGGGNIGFKGVNCSEEKEIALNLSKELKKEIEELGGEACLTREDDEEVLLTDRAHMVNKLKPDFLISIHLNYMANSNKKGAGVYYFRGDRGSEKLGNIIMKNLETIGAINRGVREGRFFLLKNVYVSSLIIEIGYLSNAEEEKNLLNSNYIKSQAKVISRSIVEYFES